MHDGCLLGNTNMSKYIHASKVHFKDLAHPWSPVIVVLARGKTVQTHLKEYATKEKVFKLKDRKPASLEKATPKS